jgi:hypothetical protein
MNLKYGIYLMIFFKNIIDMMIFWMIFKKKKLRRWHIKLILVNLSNLWPQSWDQDNLIENKSK